MPFLQLVWANLFGRPVRSLLTLLGVAVAVGAVVSLVGISAGFERSLRDAFTSRGVDLLVMQAGKVQQSSSVLPESLGPKIAAIPGVQSVAAGLADVVTLEGDSLFGVSIQAWTIDSFLIKQFNVVEGEPLHRSGERELLLGKAVAAALDKKPGDTLNVLEGETFTILGVFESFNVFENGSIIMPLPDLQELMLREGDVTAFAVVSEKHDRASVEALQAKIEKIQSGLQVALAREFAENAPEMQITKSLAWLTSSVALIVGAVGVLNTMLMAVFERTGELAMMRAVGWRSTRVLKLILAEALLLALAGAVLGALGAVFVTWSLSQSPEAGRLVSGEIPLHVVAQGFVVAIVLGVLGGLYPAYRAARLTPVDGLRHD